MKYIYCYYHEPKIAISHPVPLLEQPTIQGLSSTSSPLALADRPVAQPEASFAPITNKSVLSKLNLQLNDAYFKDYPSEDVPIKGVGEGADLLLAYIDVRLALNGATEYGLFRKETSPELAEKVVDELGKLKATLGKSQRPNTQLKAFLESWPLASSGATLS
ncbi:MAG: hypothetical protein M1829_006198 [Trizodia sp. TS-e1964]|nr:MAG: hypothetical protein M1829_006198 [Trizodia sp. TS-e1964]